MGELISAHPKYALIRLEVRIHAAGSGLPDLLAGDVPMEKFVDRVKGFWWERGLRNHRGLKLITEREELEAALEEFQTAYPSDRIGASRQLVRRLLDPVAERAGKPYWVEVSGKNIQSSPTISELFPNAKFIHMFRDGRAVVASMINKESTTDDPLIGLRHWNRRVRNADAAMRRMPPGKILMMRLEDLAHDDREGSYRRLIEHLGIPDDQPIREHFDREISPDAAHIGKWRERISEADARRTERIYARILRNMHRDGITWVPTPEQAGLRPPRVTVPVVSTRWGIHRPFTPITLRRAAGIRVRRLTPPPVRRAVAGRLRRTS